MILIQHGIGNSEKLLDITQEYHQQWCSARGWRYYQDRKALLRSEDLKIPEKKTDSNSPFETPRFMRKAWPMRPEDLPKKTDNSIWFEKWRVIQDALRTASTGELCVWIDSDCIVVGELSDALDEDKDIGLVEKFLKYRKYELGRRGGHETPGTAAAQGPDVRQGKPDPRPHERIERTSTTGDDGSRRPARPAARTHYIPGLYNAGVVYLHANEATRKFVEDVLSTGYVKPDKSTPHTPWDEKTMNTLLPKSNLRIQSLDERWNSMGTVSDMRVKAWHGIGLKLRSFFMSEFMEKKGLGTVRRLYSSINVIL